MTKLLAHYDAKLKAFVPDEAVDLPEGTTATLRVIEDDPLPPFPANARAHFIGGPGLSGQELVRRLGELDGPIFTEKEPDPAKVARRWRSKAR